MRERAQASVETIALLAAAMAARGRAPAGRRRGSGRRSSRRSARRSRVRSARAPRRRRGSIRSSGWCSTVPRAPRPTGRRCSTCARICARASTRPEADAAFAAILRPLDCTRALGGCRSTEAQVASSSSTARPRTHWLRDRFHPGVVTRFASFALGLAGGPGAIVLAGPRSRASQPTRRSRPASPRAMSSCRSATACARWSCGSSPTAVSSSSPTRLARLDDGRHGPGLGRVRRPARARRGARRRARTRRRTAAARRGAERVRRRALAVGRTAPRPSSPARPTSPTSSPRSSPRLTASRPTPRCSRSGSGTATRTRIELADSLLLAAARATAPWLGEARTYRAWIRPQDGPYEPMAGDADGDRDVETRLRAARRGLGHRRSAAPGAGSRARASDEPRRRRARPRRAGPVRQARALVRRCRGASGRGGTGDDAAKGDRPRPQGHGRHCCRPPRRRRRARGHASGRRRRQLARPSHVLASRTERSRSARAGSGMAMNRPRLRRTTCTSSCLRPGDDGLAVIAEGFGT